MLAKTYFEENHNQVVFANRCTFVPLGIICFSLLYPAYLYYTRRYIYPISMRKPVISLFGSSCVIAYMFWLCVSWTLSDYIPTFIYTTLSTSLLLMAAFVYLWRAWMLYFLSRLAAENALGVDLKIGDLPTNTFFHRNRYLISNRVLLWITSLLFVMVCSPSVYFSFSSEEFRTLPVTYSDLNPEKQSVLKATEISLFVLLILFCLIAYKLRSVGNDAFGIRAELIGCARFMILGFIVFFILDLVLTPITSAQIPLGSLVVCLLGLVYCTLIIPLKSSYRDQSSTQSRNQDVQSKLAVFEDFLLFSTEGYEAFVEFSKSEFSIENIIFWKRCYEFNGSWNEAVNIYQMFLAKESPFEVNLPSRIQDLYRDKLFKDIRANSDEKTRISAIVPTPDGDPYNIFKDAVIEVLHLMESGTFVRFVKIKKHLTMWENYLKSRAQEIMLKKICSISLEYGSGSNQRLQFLKI